MLANLKSHDLLNLLDDLVKVDVVANHLDDYFPLYYVYNACAILTCRA